LTLKKKLEEGTVDLDTLVARTLLREAADGVAAHSDYARHLVLLLKKAAEGKGGDQGIKDEAALRRNARLWKIPEEGRSISEVALDLANLLLHEFASQEDLLATVNLAPAPQRAVWEKLHISPLGVDRMVVEALHNSAMGVNQDYVHLLLSAIQVSLADGWGASRIASAVADILFGTPMPTQSGNNLLALRGEKVNAATLDLEAAAKGPLVSGFSVEAIRYMLGGTFRASFRPLNDAIMSGRIRGVAGLVGCENPSAQVDSYIHTLTTELLKNNVLVLTTGGAALGLARVGMLSPEMGLVHTGSGLREVCEAVGMPPVLHMGNGVDNTRILEAATEIVREGGLGDDLSQIPAVGLAPEWMDGKAVAAGCYFVASGIDVVLGHPFHIGGSDKVGKFLGEGAQEAFGASFHVCADPHEAAKKVLELLEADRDRLGINRKQERKMYDMKDRRDLVV